jgi:hypothetical protein
VFSNGLMVYRVLHGVASLMAIRSKQSVVGSRTGDRLRKRPSDRSPSYAIDHMTLQSP